MLHELAGIGDLWWPIVVSFVFLSRDFGDPAVERRVADLDVMFLRQHLVRAPGKALTTLMDLLDQFAIRIDLVLACFPRDSALVLDDFEDRFLVQVEQARYFPLGLALLE